MRLGQFDRSIAKAGLMGRRKAAEFRQLAKEQTSFLATIYGAKSVCNVMLEKLRLATLSYFG